MKNNKSNIDIINDNIRKSIKNEIIKSAPEVAEIMINKLKSNNLLRNELSYYRKVEILLSTLHSFKDAVKQKEEELEEIKRYGIHEKSKSIVCYSSAGGVAPGDRYLELEEKYMKEKKETEREINRIEKALDKIKDDKYFTIIELKYLNFDEKSKTDEEIAEILGKDRTTIIRNKKRLINKLKVILFPQSIQELM